MHRPFTFLIIRWEQLVREPRSVDDYNIDIADIIEIEAPFKQRALDIYRSKIYPDRFEPTSKYIYTKYFVDGEKDDPTTHAKLVNEIKQSRDKDVARVILKKYFETINTDDLGVISALI